MIKKHISIFLFITFLNVFYAQELLYDEAGSQLKSRKVVCDLGEDIRGNSSTAVILDASRSQPNNGSLTYEWSFAPNLLFQDDYSFEQFDSMIPYTESELEGLEPSDRVSIKKIITRNKFLELDLPSVSSESQYGVILRVQNLVGSSDSDTMVITVDPAISIESASEFSDIPLSEDENNYTVMEDAGENREPLTETVINAGHLTIQPINKGRLNPMEVDIINSFVYDFLKSRGTQDVLDPNRDIPSLVQVNKEYGRTRVEPDTVLLVTNDTLSTKEDRSGYVSAPVDTIFTDANPEDTTTTSDTSYVYRKYETVTSVDTLYYTEVVDTTLEYKFNCQTFDCAAENAFLERAGQVLTWGINDYSQLEFHYFKLGDIYENEPTSFWEADTIVMSPHADSILRYPESIGFESDGSLVVVSGNRQSVNKLGIEMHPENAISKSEDKESLYYPSGVCSGYLGELYITDKHDHTVKKIYEGATSTIYSTPRDENGLIRNDEPNTPTSIRVDPEGNVVVLFEGDGSVQQFDPKGNRTTLLAPGVINKPSDIALSSDGSLFVSSMTAGVVFRVAMDGSVIPVAGTESTLATAMDGVMALESYIGSPVSIDFDSLNRLYIADNMFGSIRVVTTDGIISTITDNDNRVMDVAQLRVNNYGMTTLYATHTLGHRLTRVQYKTVSNSSRFKYIHYPYYIILKEGIYGLEEPIKTAVESALGDLVPKKKVSIFTKISDRNRRIAAYLKSHPLLFGILLVLLNQGVSAALSGDVAIDLPPDFPF